VNTVVVNDIMGICIVSFIHTGTRYPVEGWPRRRVNNDFYACGMSASMDRISKIFAIKMCLELSLQSRDIISRFYC
jgi:hypothetical protein